MSTTIRTLLVAAISAGAALAPIAASAQAPLQWGPRHIYEPEATGSLGGRAPWNTPSQFDSGSDNDKHPSRPYYQQGGGQQTGGPSRNLLPYDGGTLVPR